MSTGIDSSRSIEVDNYDWFKTFKGGRTGVQNRFGFLIKNGFNQVSAEEKENYCRDMEISPKDFSAVCNSDYSVLTQKMIQDCAGVMIFGLDEGFGDNPLTLEQINEVEGLMKKNPYANMIPTKTAEGAAKLYLVMQAYRNF